MWDETLEAADKPEAAAPLMVDVNLVRAREAQGVDALKVCSR